MTWQKGMKKITKSSGGVDAVRPPFRVHAIPSAFGCRRCKKCRIIDTSGLRAVDFFPNCLTERFRVFSLADFTEVHVLQPAYAILQEPMTPMESADEFDEESEYEVEELLDVRYRNGEPEYLIKWKGHPS
ncbi:hypothetical protein CLF_112256 [Clonorchis sinensis]|uniref:Chromo domain-containing protein n=1 Tax=Clonorchis sinensis TaxID=79923 RepID=G7YW27_CLOSI|nr:hypothetical protein CLF_112256 [Clonorchis sinensis]